MSTPTESRREKVRFSYGPGAWDVAGAVRLLRDVDLGFAPDEIRITALGEDAREVAFDPSAWEQVAATPGCTGFQLKTVEPAGPSLVVRVGRGPVGLAVTLGGVRAPDDLVHRLVDAAGLVVGQRGDSEDSRWQGEVNPSHYRMWFDGPWEHLPRTLDDDGAEVIDVSGNPGRIFEVAQHWLWAAQDVWFGSGARLFLDVDAVPGLPVAAVEDLGAGRWHARLWEDGAALEQIRATQQAVRDGLGFDAAVEREDEIWDELTAGQPDDPMFVAQEGTYAEGGTKRFLQYFSASKQPTTRSRAATLVVQVFDDEQQEVGYEEVDLTSTPHPDLG